MKRFSVVGVREVCDLEMGVFGNGEDEMYDSGVEIIIIIIFFCLWKCCCGK